MTPREAILLFKHALLGNVIDSQEHIFLPAVLAFYGIHKNMLKTFRIHKTPAFKDQVFSVRQRRRNLAPHAGRKFFSECLMAG
jgi:hypothetical protein